MARRPQPPESTPTEADRQHINDTLAAGTVALQTSNFALSKAQNPRLKRFAEFEIGEQNTLADVLHSLSEPTSTASTGAAQAASTAPVLSQQASAMMERKCPVRSPARRSIRINAAGQIQGHQELLAIQEHYLKSAPPNRELVAIARLAQNTIQEHLYAAAADQGRVGPIALLNFPQPRSRNSGT